MAALGFMPSSKLNNPDSLLTIFLISLEISILPIPGTWEMDINIGILATCAAFLAATYQLRTGNRNSFNRFLRARVIAQGATIAACVIGGYIYRSDSQTATELKAEERRRELEKIKVAGTGRAPAPDELTPSSLSNPRADESSLSTARPPPTPAAQSFWSQWGVNSSGRP